MSKELQTVKSRSFISTVSLLMQSSFSAILGFAAFFILTKQSGVYLLGIYSTVEATLSFFNYLTNIGLAAALMQRSKLDTLDINTAFFMQMGIAVVGVTAGFIITPFVMSAYPDLPSNAAYLYWAILCSLLLLQLKMIPSVLLEKEIQIQKVVISQLLEATVFYVVIILMVTLGYDIESLIVAVLARAVVGVVSINVLHPWVPSLEFSWDRARSLFTYGIQFQGNSFLALIKDNLLILYLGSRLGFTQLGYVSFAKKYAEFAIRLIMDTINRVGFPVLSRFQDDRALLSKSMKRVLYYQSLLIFPMLAGGMFIFASILHVIPGYLDKWQTAVFSFYFFSLSSLFISFSTPFINLFNATGKVRWSLYCMALFTALTWIFVSLGVQWYGYMGVSVGFLLFSISFLIPLFVSRGLVDVSLWESIEKKCLCYCSYVYCTWDTPIPEGIIKPFRKTLFGIGTCSGRYLLWISSASFQQRATCTGFRHLHQTQIWKEYLEF
ncbi:MAG: Lipopolysaccharide biosynthesis protein WzxC [Microgenomates bacterium OLB22]|nr:MAG: Lipopolysaccharide biosynthesis protein WzxC [Microgenomates bacterium OLB22]